jgi:hypothetical protein
VDVGSVRGMGVARLKDVAAALTQESPGTNQSRPAIPSCYSRHTRNPTRGKKPFFGVS